MQRIRSTRSPMMSWKNTSEQSTENDMAIVSWSDFNCNIAQLLTKISLISSDTDTDTDTEAFSSLQISGAMKSPPTSPPGVVMQIQTTRVVPSQPEVVLSDGEFRINSFDQITWWNELPNYFGIYGQKTYWLSYVKFYQFMKFNLYELLFRLLKYSSYYIYFLNYPNISTSPVWASYQLSQVVEAQ